MRNWQLPFLAVLAIITLGALAYSNISAQQDMSCPALIEQALAAVGDNCAGLERNSACYGFQDVRATFSEPIAPDFFTQPRDRAELIALRNIGTSPLDTALARWGIALLSLQADLPDTLPGQNTIFMLLGDAEVENAVSSEDVFAGGGAIEVRTNAAAPLFFYLDMREQSVGRVPESTLLRADAIDETGAWVRVAYEGMPGWIARRALEPQADMDSLPILSPSTQGSMQSFYLRTGITGTQCSEAPDALVVQGPRNLAVEINANGADIRLGSTIALRVIPITSETRVLFAPIYRDIGQVTQMLELVVIDGQAILDPRTPGQIIVPQGFRTLRCLSETQNLGLDAVENDREVFAACPWLPPERLTQTELDTYRVLQGVRLNYPIRLPSLPTPTPTPTRTRRPASGGVRLPTRTPSPTVTPTATLTATPTATATFTPTETWTFTPTATDTETFTPTPTATWTFTPTATDTETFTPTFTKTFTPTDTPTDIPTATDTPTDAPTPTDTPTDFIID